MNKNTVVRSRKRAKSPEKRPAGADNYGRALERLAEEFAGRGRADGDHVAASVAIGLLQLAAFWRTRQGKACLTISTEACHAR